VTTKIVIDGTGWCEQRADKVELDLNFEAEAATRTGAVEALGGRLRVLDAPPIGAERISYRQFGVHSDAQDKRGPGFRAHEGVGIRLLDIDALEDVLAALVAAEPASMMGPRWLLRDATTAYREAQRLAVADSRERAEVYAEILGGRLGALRRLTDHGGHDAMNLSFGGRESASMIGGLGLEPEPVRITARCTTSWTLIT
jgi:uncharacterized protein